MSSEDPDGADQQTVYRSSSKYAKTFHIDRECRYLKQAETVIEKPAWVAKRSPKAICAECDGRYVQHCPDGMGDMEPSTPPPVDVQEPFVGHIWTPTRGFVVPEREWSG